MASSRETVEAFEALKQYLIDNFRAKPASGGREVVKRCHLCGDSRDPSDAHMYIGLRPDGKIAYNCFKCNSGGIVTRQFLKDLACYDENLITMCETQNKSSGSSKGTYSGKVGSINFRKLLLPVSANEFAMKKLDYISRRLGVQFNAQDAARFKIILNLKDFLDINNITRYTRHPDMVDALDKFFIGFLSMDNRYVMMRRLVPEGKLPEFIDYRYVNYDISGSSTQGIKYYAVPNIVDITRPMEIHMAEGAFDILSSYLFVAPMGVNATFVAIGGKAYENAVKFLISQYGFIGFVLHIYADADVNDRMFVNIKNMLAPFNIPVFIHRNRMPGEKDFGVSMDKIQEQKYKL